MKLIRVGARASKLSIKQVEEFLEALKLYHPNICFSLRVCQVTGDKDQKSSLRHLDKTNFFTKELDHWLLEDKCDITLHSAKDLPEPLDSKLDLACVTSSLNSEDVVVFHKNIDPTNLKGHVKIATSSIQRARNVLAQFPRSVIADIRGSVLQRLQKIEDGEVDGVVVAKVALIRLGLTNLNTCFLNGSTAPLQGSLAALTQKGREELKKLLAPLDSRLGHKTLYTGLSAHKVYANGLLYHLPLIEITPLNFSQSALQKAFDSATHLIITSQQTLCLLLQTVSKEDLNKKTIVVVGQKTAKAFQEKKIYVSYIARDERQEGIIELLKKNCWGRAIFLYIKSKNARKNLVEFLEKNDFSYRVFDLYETQSKVLPDKSSLKNFDQIVFTSPSCVDAFFENFKALPQNLKVICKGAVTSKALEYALEKTYSKTLSIRK